MTAVYALTLNFCNNDNVVMLDCGSSVCGQIVAILYDKTAPMSLPFLPSCVGAYWLRQTG